MKDFAKLVLSQTQDHSEIKTIKPVSGGSINESFYLETEQQSYFLKYHDFAPDNFFYYEQEGLELIRSTNSIQVPEVYSYSDEENYAYLLLEWVEGTKATRTENQLGHLIAKMHQTEAKRHGVDHKTFIGILEQPNQLYNEWVDYYKECRLKRQLDIGIENHHLTGKRRNRFEKLITRLDQFIPKGIKPTYLHGDLWGGNWLVGPNGSPYVIDPSFLYGDRHFDLAFTELFGGFSHDFYQAYSEQNPPESYYEDVKELYQLYYLLVHLNIFGEVYGGAVDRVLKKYIG
ncbi:fructosamine kinase family protein [Piscibacillus sp. B03]|uniref:fructosamine kinase family protein n=1 Tax=Piscibacillus sp. B03 TaxID=3457430 RepID=UPI003FCC6DF0